MRDYHEFDLAFIASFLYVLLVSALLVNLHSCGSTPPPVEKQVIEHCLFEASPAIMEEDHADAITCYEKTVFNLSTGEVTAPEEPVPVECERIVYQFPASEMVKLMQCLVRNHAKIYTGN